MNFVPFSLFAVDLIGTLAGIHVMQSAQLSRKITAVSSGVMLGVGLFWILPDITQSAGILHAFLSVTVAITALFGVDRYIYPVCPCCSHLAHSTCQRLPDALLPLVIAIGVHNLFDGWTAGIALHSAGMLRSGIVMGLIAHKIPEGLIFGMMLRATSSKRNVLLPSALITGLCILAGYNMYGEMKLVQASLLVTLSMAIACASFVFVGLHSFQLQRRRTGTKPALLFLAAGVAGTVVIEKGLSLALR
jgi:zinc transporter ZupT